MESNFSKICRLCLRLCDEYVDLNDTNGSQSLAADLLEKIKFCYCLQVDLSDGCPTKVCYECIQVLSYFYLAKRNALSSDKFLREMLLVKKKVQEGSTSREENVTVPDMIEIPQEEQTNNSNVEADFVKKLNQKMTKSNKSNTVNSQSVAPSTENQSEIICEAVITTPKEKIVANGKGKNTVQCQDEFDKLLNISNTNLEILHKFLEIKKLDQSRKGRAKSSRQSKENVKVIGTVIDTSNILSPCAKRTRKSTIS